MSETKGEAKNRLILRLARKVCPEPGVTGHDRDIARAIVDELISDPVNIDLALRASGRTDAPQIIEHDAVPPGEAFVMSAPITHEAVCMAVVKRNDWECDCGAFARSMVKITGIGGNDGVR